MAKPSSKERVAFQTETFTSEWINPRKKISEKRKLIKKCTSKKFLERNCKASIDVYEGNSNDPMDSRLAGDIQITVVGQKFKFVTKSKKKYLAEYCEQLNYCHHQIMDSPFISFKEREKVDKMDKFAEKIGCK